MIPRRIGLIAVVAGALVVVLAGCTSSGTGGATVNGTPVFTESAPTNTPTDTTTATSTDTTTSASPTTSATAATSTPSTASKNDCRLDELTVRALPGSGDNQREYAAVTFTNSGTRTCTMFGFPGISMRLHDQLIGSPAARSSMVPHTVTLKPGDQAEASITDFSTCNAPISDTLRIYPPNSTQFVDRPMHLGLRACRIVVDPVVLSQ